MAINERLIDTEVAAAGNGGTGTGNQEEGLILHLDANDVDSYDGDGTEWVDITNHEYTPSTDVSEHFNTVLYTGNGTTNSTEQNITGVGFQPDLVWIKNRGETRNHVLVDSLRKTGNLLDELHSNSTDAAKTDGTDNVKSLDSDGFTVLGQGSETNDNGDTFVAWCFKAGGAAVSNTDGTITSQVSANNDLGFSIVKYTGNLNNTTSATGAPIGHGLGTTPELIIFKNLSTTTNWHVYSKDLANWGTRLYLNETSAADNVYSSYPIANPTGSVFYTNYLTAQNVNNHNYIAYCFASKRGVSKVGSYTGTGAAGNKVYTGFEPAFIMVKSTSFAERWAIYDNKRSVQDPRSKVLAANVNSAEIDTVYYNINFDRDGFTVDGTANFSNKNGETFIYYAIAKNTNETSLIPDTDLELHLDAASFPEKGESGYSNTPSTWTDSSGNSNNGTIAGATFDSELGNYLNFDGINDMVTTSYDIPSVGAKTIEFWFNDNGSSGTNSTYPSPVGGSNAAIWTGGDLTGSYSDESLGFYNADTLLHFYIRTGTNTYRDNKWHHVAITDNGSNQHAVYVDGESHSISYLNGSSSSRISMNNVQIGKGRSTPTTGSYSYYFNGQVGQVRIYSSALTQDQVRQNYNFTKPNYPNGFDGDISGATWNSAGYFQFDGSNDEIDLTSSHPYSSNDVQTNSVKSITGWVKLDSGTRAMLYSISSTANSNYYFTCQVRNDSNGVFMQCRDGGTTNSFIDKATNSAPDSNWHHYVFQLDGDERQIYIDGVKKTLTKDNRGTATDSSWISYPTYSSSAKHKIQKGREISAYYGTGKVSKVKHYTRPLTQEEITALYNEGE
jgi:hypothetical protein